MLTKKTLAFALSIGGALLLGAAGDERTMPHSRDKGKPKSTRPIEPRPQTRGGGVSFDDVWSREFSILNGDTAAQTPVFGDVISREFSIHSYAPDLAVSNLSATPTDLTSQVFTLSWTVTNVGQRTASGRWFDQVVVTHGNSTQVALCLPNSEDLAPGGSYTHTESVCFPEAFQQPGAYPVFVNVDVDNSIAEQVGPADNSDNNQQSITVNLQSSFSPLPACTPPPECLLANVPGFNVEIYATGTTYGGGAAIGADGTIYLGRQLSGGCCDPARILRVGLGGTPVSEFGNEVIIDPDSVVVDDFGLISGIPGSVLVSAGGSIVAVRPDQSVVTLFDGLGNTSQAVFDLNNRLLIGELYELAPSVGRINQTSGGVPSLFAQVNCLVGPWQQCQSYWLAVSPMNEVYSWWSDGWIRVHDQNGTLVEDAFARISPYLGTVPPYYGAPMVFGPGDEAFGSDLYVFDVANGVILRMDSTGTPQVFGTGFEGSSIFFGPDGAMYFSEEGRGRILRITPNACSMLSEFQPAPGGQLIIGSSVSLQGRVVVPGLGTAAVTINGQPADSMDAWGRFFHAVTIETGQNCFEIVATLETGVDCTKTVCYEGVSAPQPEFENTADVYLSITPRYSNTTYNPATQIFITHVQAENTDPDSARVYAPLMMIFDSISDPNVTLASFDGLTEDGRPYFLLVDPNSEAYLEPGQRSDPRALAFHNPNGVQVRFTVSWRAALNRAPLFESIPVTATALGRDYEYPCNATDPDGDMVTYRLDAAPTGMALDSMTGSITWTPISGDAGSHSVIIVADDGRGGRATQSFVIEVAAQAVNSPPAFASTPPTSVSAGAIYTYQATTTDPDGDPPTFTKLAGPMDLDVDPGTGLVTWPFTLLNNCPPQCDNIVSIQVSDGFGGIGVQTYVLTVGNLPTNPHAPSLFGTPGALAAVGTLYLYQPTAGDDDGDVLEYRLDVFPANMQINTSTGRVNWTPAANQVGLHTVTLAVDDQNGGITTQTWVIEVKSSWLEINRPPVILSSPPLTASQNTPYNYQIEAADPEGFPVTFELVNPPCYLGICSPPCHPNCQMTVNAAGVISWPIPGPGQTNPPIGIKAIDPQGAFGSQVYTLTVYPPNTAPMISSSTPPTTIVAGQTYRHDVDATDADGNTLTYRLVGARPNGMTINPTTGLILWTTTAAQIGNNQFSVEVRDQFGGIDSEGPITVIVSPDTTSPGALIVFSHDPANVNEPVLVCVQGGDNVGIAQRTLTADGDAVSLDGFGCAVYTPTVAGVPVAFAATVVDPAGNIGSANRNLQVTDPGAPPPVITLVTPTLPATVNCPTALSVTITDSSPGQMITWEAKIRRVDSPTYEEQLGASNGQVAQLTTPTQIALIDPTNRLNEVHFVQICATGLNQRCVEFQVSITGEIKLGNFTMTFTDLTLPVAGIPLVVTRTYDSLDTRTGDFGAGWRLGLPGKLSDSADDSATTSPQSWGAFNPSTRVYVTKPDGRRVGFSFAPTPVSSFFPFLFRADFRADDGVQDTLRAVDAPGYVWLVGGQFLDVYTPFNPRLYELTTKDRAKYTIDEHNGLLQIEDVNGNTIDVTPGGLISSTGLSLVFERDAQGRITRITEPDTDPMDSDPPGYLEYIYDTNSNLKFYRDFAGAETEYFYKQGAPAYLHYLEKIEDPLNRQIIRSFYDDTGKLVAVCDANATPMPPDDWTGCTEFIHATAVDITTTTIINARGCRTDLVVVFTSTGREEHEIHYPSVVGPDGNCTPTSAGDPVETVRVYDLDDNLLSETSPPTPEAPSGYEWGFTYDDRGNQLTRTDPGQRTWVYTYSDCNKVTSETDPMGNETTYVYDDYCNLRFVTDTLGGITEYKYENPFRQRSHFIDAVGNTWHFSYDGNGYPSGFIDPLNHSAMMHFNDAGELEYSIDRRGWRIDFEYDDAHRVRREIWRPNTTALDPGDLTTDRITEYSYNVAGQIETAVDPDSALTMTYFPTGLLETVDNVGTPGAPRVRIDYTYDGNGNVLSVTDLHGLGVPIAQGVTEYAYDSRDRLAHIEQYGVNGAPVNDKSVYMNYDDAGALKLLERFGSLNQSVPVAKTIYEYDCGVCPSRVSAIRHRKASDNSVIHDLEFDRDSLGNILEMRDAEGMHRYTYDGLRRLLTAEHPVGGPQPDEFYTYDAVGNRLSSHLSATYSYSYQPQYNEGGNQLRIDNQFDYTYDRNGNLIVRSERNSPRKDLFHHNHRNRVVSLAHYDDGFTLDRLQSFIYDSGNRRIRLVDPKDEVHFAFDGQNPMLKLSGMTITLARRMYSRSIDGVLSNETSATREWLINDQIGSIRGLIEDGGGETNYYVYDTFGSLLAELNPKVDNDLLFAGREYDRPSGFLCLRARLYGPSIGRFLSEDQLKPFRYEYVDNNPLVFVDPTGNAVGDVIGRVAVIKGILRGNLLIRLQACGGAIAILGLSALIETIEDPLARVVADQLIYKLLSPEFRLLIGICGTPIPIGL